VLPPQHPSLWCAVHSVQLHVCDEQVLQAINRAPLTCDEAVALNLIEDSKYRCGVRSLGLSACICVRKAMSISAMKKCTLRWFLNTMVWLKLALTFHTGSALATLQPRTSKGWTLNLSFLQLRVDCAELKHVPVTRCLTVDMLQTLTLKCDPLLFQGRVRDGCSTEAGAEAGANHQVPDSAGRAAQRQKPWRWVLRAGGPLHLVLPAELVPRRVVCGTFMPCHFNVPDRLYKSMFQYLFDGRECEIKDSPGAPQAGCCTNPNERNAGRNAEDGSYAW
jgi:hypothetical protein